MIEQLLSVLHKDRYSPKYTKISYVGLFSYWHISKNPKISNAGSFLSSIYPSINRRTKDNKQIHYWKNKKEIQRRKMMEKRMKASFVAMVMVIMVMEASSWDGLDRIKLVSDGGSDMETTFTTKRMKNGFPSPINRCALPLRMCHTDCNCPSYCVCNNGVCSPFLI